MDNVSKNSLAMPVGRAPGSCLGSGERERLDALAEHLADAMADSWRDGERPLAELVGSWPEDRPACSPFGNVARVLRLPEGAIVLLPASVQRSGRPIVGATVAVASLDPVRRFLPRAVEECPGSLWVETHGLWLEFRAR